MPEDIRTLLVVGDDEVAAVADALAAVATALGWSATTVDDLDAVHRALPVTDAVVVLSHHQGLDGPSLAAALDSDVRYVGAMGSRRTQARRKDWLVEHGVSEETQARIHGPAGLDIGADTPAEIAVSILAEVIAVRHDLSGGALSARSGPIHPDLAAGEALCPGEPDR
ncbi:MAG TPA: XdhC family protein [Nocardioidaceae bacterium]|jgi:xanthine dehydrogenase accessory factor|nr:XdhC family protein [Nocardioidaceae bacterium]